MDVGAIRSSSDDIQTTNGDQPQKYGAMLSRSISAIAIRYKGHQFLHVTIVFPMEMKEFPHKLSSSGWDIARERGNLPRASAERMTANTSCR